MFTFFIITFGCQMNKSDSERIAGLLISLGGVEAGGPDKSDLVLLNTCSVRKSAEDRIFGQIHNLKQLKNTRPDLIIGITGCLPGRDKDGALRRQFSNVDLFFPITDLPKLADKLIDLGLIKAGAQNSAINYWEIIPRFRNTYQAMVPIQFGCNNFCAYCIVPFARGRETNRPMADILCEVRDLASRGFLEIQLLGQVVNNYQAPDAKNFSFADLLLKINQIEGINRIQFVSVDPQYIDDEMIEALALPKIMNYLHLAVQSGSNEILKKMNRKYTVGKFLKIAEKIRKIRPDIALGTDIIVGFPGETENDFQKTVELYKSADFDIAYLAQYSPRPGTAAAHWADDVPHLEKERRWRVLQNLMEEIVLRKNQKYVGQTVEVLVERCVDANKNIYVGNSREYKLVEFESGVDVIGKIVKVRINKAEMWRLTGINDCGIK
ncbi:MAG: tRNA (N6-isopentenyl adenosine(37)-C2)-methylthiotransferase MiaB [Candidatus Magasanikbacteria bacterium]|nr:tRNA (N6-isopentenyl adenosine(37)-C2)-methylthiotransferase MiaB [Candidatus Magasanikbacteria bacterium]